MSEEEIRSVLSQKAVGFAGCGGLGSHSAMSLARAGIGTFFLADFDVVQEEDFSRQCFFRSQEGMLKIHALRDNILDVNPDAKIYCFDVRLCPSDVYELFQTADVVIEAVDDAKTKLTIIEALQKHAPEKPVVSGVGMAGWGNTEALKVNQMNTLYLCGDLISKVSDDMPLTAARVGIVANMQANVAIELMLKENGYGSLH